MRILITSVSAGAGHVKAAEAIQAALRRRFPSIHAVHVDVMNFVTARFLKIYVDGYNFAINYTPGLWGRLYDYWDRQDSSNKVTSLLYRAQRHYAAAFFDYLARFDPHLIITTHFFVPQLLSEGPTEVSAPLECVITDYDLHRFWVSDRISRYYVAHDGIAGKLRDMGVSADKISATGIPVHPIFDEHVGLRSLYQNYNLEPGLPVILVLSGGTGLSSQEKAVKALLRSERPMQILTVSGRNEALLRRLERLQAPAHIALRNLGYVSNMHELLSLSDMVITKPGGLTVSECLAKKKIMILFSPIPGQEERNADFVVRKHAGVRAEHWNDLPVVVDRLLSDPALRSALRRNLDACARPKAAFDIVSSAMSCFAA
jgi:processive 1,2-diacylglycerol beta-glucosyltransferase